MSDKAKPGPRCFHAHETARAGELNGLPLATFGQRVLGYVVDLLLAVVIWFPCETAYRMYVLHEKDIHIEWDFHEKGNLIVMLLYWGLFNYFGNGRTPGKWVARTRAMSLTGERLGLWQSVERALGYGAAVLEGGLGFLQFFWDRNRQCAQDRLAETIVVDTRKKKLALPDGPATRGAGVHTPFYSFAWLSRWSRRKSVLDQRESHAKLLRVTK